MRDRPTILGICVVVAVGLALLWGSSISLPWHAARANGWDTTVGGAASTFPPQVVSGLPNSQPSSLPSVSACEVMNGGQPPSMWGWTCPSGPVLPQLPTNDLAETVVPAPPDPANFLPANTGWGHTLMRPTVPGNWAPAMTLEADSRQPHNLAETAMTTQDDAANVPVASGGWGHTFAQSTASDNQTLAATPRVNSLQPHELADTAIVAPGNPPMLPPAVAGWGHTVMVETTPGDRMPAGKPYAGSLKPHQLAETPIAVQGDSSSLSAAATGWGHTLMQQPPPDERVLSSLTDDRPPMTKVAPAKVSTPPPSQGYDEDAPGEKSSSDDRPAADPKTPDAEEMFVPIGKLEAQIAVEGDVPDDLAAEQFSESSPTHDPGALSRGWPIAHCHWKAPGLCHQPLYFEETNLERHGFSAGGVQPLVSGARFFGTVGMLPYSMVVDPPDKCRYTLGHYRPGSPVPPHINSIPCRWDAATVQAAAVTAAFIAIP